MSLHLFLLFATFCVLASAYPTGSGSCDIPTVESLPAWKKMATRGRDGVATVSITPDSGVQAGDAITVTVRAPVGILGFLAGAYPDSTDTSTAIGDNVMPTGMAVRACSNDTGMSVITHSAVVPAGSMSLSWTFVVPNSASAGSYLEFRVLVLTGVDGTGAAQKFALVITPITLDAGGDAVNDDGMGDAVNDDGMGDAVVDNGDDANADDAANNGDDAANNGDNAEAGETPVATPAQGDDCTCDDANHNDDSGAIGENVVDATSAQQDATTTAQATAVPVVEASTDAPATEVVVETSAVLASSTTTSAATTAASTTEVRASSTTTSATTTQEDTTTTTASTRASSAASTTRSVAGSTRAATASTRAATTRQTTRAGSLTLPATDRSIHEDPVPVILSAASTTAASMFAVVAALLVVALQQ